MDTSEQDFCLSIYWYFALVWQILKIYSLSLTNTETNPISDQYPDLESWINPKRFLVLYFLPWKLLSSKQNTLLTRIALIASFWPQRNLSLCFVVFHFTPTITLHYLHKFCNNFRYRKKSFLFFNHRFVLICCERLIPEMHHVLGFPWRFLNKSCQLPSNLDKYILQFGKIHFEMIRNIFGNVDKYIPSSIPQQILLTSISLSQILT